MWVNQESSSIADILINVNPGPMDRTIEYVSYVSNPSDKESRGNERRREGGWLLSNERYSLVYMFLESV